MIQTGKARRKVCRVYTKYGLEKLGRILERVGDAFVHSEDESDHETNEPLYRILGIIWRSKDLQMALRLLDLLHLGLKFQEDGRVGPGKWFRRRVPSPGKAKNSKPHAGLPRNFYDATWLAAQSKETKRNLMMGEPVSLAIPLKLKMYVDIVL